MPSNINPSLEPTKSLVNFRFWCQKVLPLVYDDSLSYYEVLGKMVVQLNDVIDDVNADIENVDTLKEAFLALQTYVNEFFDDIDQLASYAERAEAAQTAANTSAINASESASNASASSLAAMDARDAAVTAKQAAETSANTASTAATNANTKANEAAQSAITAQTAQASASQSATLAATDRSAAQTAASTATTKANEASTSASNAETSAENAAQSETNAEELVNNIQENLDNIQQNTQDIINLNEFGAQYTFLNFQEQTSYGLTITKESDGLYHFVGEPSNNIFLTLATINAEEGKTYHYNLDANFDNNEFNYQYFFLYGVNGSTEWIRLTPYTFTALNNHAITFRSYLTTGHTYDFKIRPYYTNELTNAQIDDTVFNNNKKLEEVIKYSPKYNMELGSINFGTHPWGYTNSNSRVRLMEGETLSLKVGDIISINNDTNIRYYLGWVTPDNQYGLVGWINYDYTATVDGEYSILLRYEPETAIANIEDITSKITIIRHNSIYDQLSNQVELNKFKDWHVKSINHRGYSRYAPENTLIAFKLSSYVGFKYVETDVRFTSDGVAVLLHDTTINRTARNADGTELSETINIADITYEQALTYDFGISRGTQFAGTKIPTFEEFLRLCRKLSLHPYIEIKDETGTHVADLVNIAKRNGMLNFCTWLAFSYTAIEKVTAVYTKARIGLIGDFTAETIQTLTNLKNQENEVFFDTPFTTATANIDQLSNAGFPVEVYTPNGIDAINNLDSYITGVTSDYNVAGEILSKTEMEAVIGIK